MIKDAGIDLRERLWISPRCHVVMPYHPMVKSIYEMAKGKGNTGTTGRGMGPVYADKVSYNGIRLVDIQDQAIFLEKLQVQLQVKNALFTAFNLEPLDVQSVLQEKLSQFAQVESMVREPFGLLQQALAIICPSFWKVPKALCWIIPGVPTRSPPLPPPSQVD